MSDDRLVAVRLVAFPLDVQQASSAWHDELLREFALVALSRADGADVPRRLLELIDATRGMYAAFTHDVEASQMQLRSCGAARGDFLYRVPAGIAGACADLDCAFDAAEAFCASGNLLTMEPPAIVSAFRRWVLGEFVQQIRDGAEPLSWDTYSAEHGRATV